MDKIFERQRGGFYGSVRERNVNKIPEPTVSHLSRSLNHLNIKLSRQALIGLLIMLLSALFGLYLYNANNEKKSALYITRPIAKGSVILAGEVGITEINASNSISILGAKFLSSVVGKRAANDLVPGELLNVSDISNTLDFPSSDEIVGIALKDTQYPIGELRSGVNVSVVFSPNQSINQASYDFVLSNGATLTLNPGSAITNAGIVIGVNYPQQNSSSSASIYASVATPAIFVNLISYLAANQEVSLVLNQPNEVVQ